MYTAYIINNCIISIYNGNLARFKRSALILFSMTRVWGCEGCEAKRLYKLLHVSCAPGALVATRRRKPSAWFHQAARDIFHQ